jgi:predicted ArsR family transcriptional regulator
VLEDRTEQGLADLAVLADAVRRRLYLHVVEQAEPVSRDAAAAAIGIGRSLAAFHLDRLVEAKLLRTEFRRLSGRTGPGAGRPSKLYRASDREVRAVVPQRRYEVAAELFAEALSAPGAGPDRVAKAASSYGSRLGQEARRRAGPRAGQRRRFEALQSVLRDAGYMPFIGEGQSELRMLNCPFHELAQRHRQLTCGMNLALVQGMLDGANLPPSAARLDSQPGVCCVALSIGEAAS